MEWAARVRSYTAHDSMILGSRTPEERITGMTPDISEFIHFTWSQWVWYKEPTSFPGTDVLLGRWMGIATDVGQAMTYWVLTNKKTIIARSSVAPLTDMDLHNPSIKDQFDKFNRECFTTNLTSSGDIKIFPEIIKELEEDVIYSTPEADNFTPECYDEYLSTQIVLPVGGEFHRGQVTRRMHDQNGKPIGTRNPNPLMDTREYEVLFPDGSVNSYVANTIAENIYSQVDEEGNNYALLREIIDHEEDTSITNGVLSQHTTKGWHLLVTWKDGSTSYVPLREIKNLFPLEMAEYAVNNKLEMKPAFIWWVPKVMQKYDCLVGKLKKGKAK